jgi:hypothetical protein
MLRRAAEKTPPARAEKHRRLSTYVARPHEIAARAKFSNRTD